MGEANVIFALANLFYCFANVIFALANLVYCFDWALPEGIRT